MCASLPCASHSSVFSVCLCVRAYVCAHSASQCGCKCTGKVVGPPRTKAQLFSEQLALLKRTSLPPLAAPRAPHHSVVEIIQLSPPPSEALCLPDFPLSVLPSLLTVSGMFSEKKGSYSTELNISTLWF